jgi:hypothetical protein
LQQHHFGSSRAVEAGIKEVADKDDKSDLVLSRTLELWAERTVLEAFSCSNNKSESVIALLVLLLRLSLPMSASISLAISSSISKSLPFQSLYRERSDLVRVRVRVRVRGLVMAWLKVLLGSLVALKWRHWQRSSMWNANKK